MEDESLPKIRSTSSSNLFSSIEILYDTLIQMAHKSIGWTTMFFEVTNYDPSTLKGSKTDLLLGIDPSHLLII